MPKTITLTQGYSTTVDDTDYVVLSRYRWKVLKAGSKIYAARTVKSPGSKHNDVTILMHRQLCPGAVRVDHENGNGLDNQRHNLRKANASYNAANTPLTKTKSHTSVYKGIYWNKRAKRWQAQIGNNMLAPKYIGTFVDEKSAAIAYDTAARLRFGEFAVLNFPGV